MSAALTIFCWLRDRLFHALGIERPSDRYHRAPSVEPAWHPAPPPRAPATGLPRRVGETRVSCGVEVTRLPNGVRLSGGRR
jgi:hypothetical protein